MSKVKLNDVAIEARETWKQNKTDVPVVGLEHLEPDEIWLKRWDLNPDENTFTKGFKKGQLLFGRRRAYQKKMSVASCDGICSGDITVIAAKPEKMLPELLPFYLRTDAFFDFAVRGSGGSLSPRVKWSHISDYEFDLPPMEEQKKLAKLLWVANDLKEKYKKAITATDEMLKAKFREMFGDIIHNDKCWPAQKLAKVMRLINGRAYAKHELLSSGKYRVLRVGNFFTNDSWYYSDMELEPDKYCEKGDLLFAWSASFGPRIWDDEKVIYHYHIWKVEHSSELDRKWAFWLLSTIAGNVKGHTHGSTMVHTTKGDMEKRIIPLPPLSLQREFVAIADKAESAKANLTKSITAIDQVMKGLINQ